MMSDTMMLTVLKAKRRIDEIQVEQALANVVAKAEDIPRLRLTRKMRNRLQEILDHGTFAEH